MSAEINGRVAGGAEGDVSIKPGMLLPCTVCFVGTAEADGAARRDVCHFANAAYAKEGKTGIFAVHPVR